MKYGRRYKKTISSVETPWTGLTVKLYSDGDTSAEVYTLTDSDSIGYYFHSSVAAGIYQIWDNTSGSLAYSGYKAEVSKFGFNPGETPEIGTALTASKIVETDADKKLKPVTKGTAYNKTFGKAVGNVPEIGEGLGTSNILETDTDAKLKTASKNTAYNKNFGEGADQVASGNHVHVEVKINGFAGGSYELVHITAYGESVIGTNNFTIEINIPANSHIASVQFRVDVALDRNWDAKFSGGLSSYIVKNVGYAQNTKKNIHINTVADSEVDIVIESGNGTDFEVEGKIRVGVYYWKLVPMNDVGA